jgi:long-chain acyl-CoA synthetase
MGSTAFGFRRLFPFLGLRIRRERTIGSLWRAAVAEGRRYPAYLAEHDGGWEPVSWEEAGARVEALANGLLALGIGKGDTVAILGRTRLEWALVDFALALVGAVSAPIYADATAADTTHALELVEARTVFADESERTALDLDALRFLSLDALDELEARGREHAAGNPEALDEAADAVGEDDLFTFLFTSGTTGPPKACMITHRNYLAMADIVVWLGDAIQTGDVLLLYLPLAHNFGRLVVLEGPYRGITIAFLSDYTRVADALGEVRPHLFPSVPRLYEKMQARIESAPGLRGRLLDWAVAVGLRERPGRAQRAVADRLVYSKVKKRLGGRLRFAFAGGAALRKEVGEFFQALDVLILEGYGLSECTTACAVNRPGEVKFGTVGRPIPGAEVRIADDGEILVRGETVFSGYYRDPEATRAVLSPDGWLRTGDLGRLDEDGFLVVTGRKKDVLVTAVGKKVSPQRIEEALSASPGIAQTLVVGNGRPYVAALLTLEEDASPETLQEHVGRVNAGLSGYEQVRRFLVLPRQFSAEKGEVTPTLKLRRDVCERHFAAEIESLYS